MTILQKPSGSEEDNQLQADRQIRDDGQPRRAALSRQIGISAAVIGVLAVGWMALVRSESSGSHPDGPAAQTATLSVPQAARHILQIETEPARAESVEAVLPATGQVSFPSDQTVKISPRLQGRVDRVLVRVGDRVSAGQTLAILDSVDAAGAQTTARQNENKLRLARSNLERQQRLHRLGTSDVTQAEANLEQAKARTQFTGEALRRIELQARIGGFTQKPLEDAETALVSSKADLAQAQSDLALAERERDRTARLVEIGVSAQRDLDAAGNSVQKAGVAEKADQDKVKLNEHGLERERKAYQTNLYADQQVRSAQSDNHQAVLQEQAAVRALQLARAAVFRDLQQARSDYQAAEADAENSRRVLALLGHPGEGGTVRVTSPIDGLVVERNVNQGQMVDQSQMTPWQMFTITNAAVIWVDADVYEKDIASIHPGQRVLVHVDALPHKQFSGTVHYVAPALDPKTHAVKVRTRIANPGALLKEGMFVDVRIDTGQGRIATLIPLSAVQHDDQGDSVFVARGGSYIKRRVRLGKQRGEATEVLSGVKPGEAVVTQGAIFLTGSGNSG